MVTARSYTENSIEIHAGSVVGHGFRYLDDRCDVGLVSEGHKYTYPASLRGIRTANEKAYIAGEEMARVEIVQRCACGHEEVIVVGQATE